MISLSLISCEKDKQISLVKLDPVDKLSILNKEITVKSVDENVREKLTVTDNNKQLKQKRSKLPLVSDSLKYDSIDEPYDTNIVKVELQEVQKIKKYDDIYYSPELINDSLIDKCIRTKALIYNQDINQKIYKLFEKAQRGGERAFMVDVNTDATDIIEGSAHNVVLENIHDYIGVYHNHTPTGIPILSPIDIYQLFHFIVLQLSSYKSVNSFIGVVGAERCYECEGGYEYFNYIFRFNGTYKEAEEVLSKDYNFKDIREKYQYFEQNYSNSPEYISSKGNFLGFKGLAKLFYKTLEMMNVNKNEVVLQRIDESGNIILVRIDDNGVPYVSPCIY